MRAGTPTELATIPLGTGMDFVRTYGIPTTLRRRGAHRASTGGTRTIDVGRVSYRTWDGEDGGALRRERRQRRHERRGRAARERHVEGARRQGDVLLRARPRLLRMAEHDRRGRARRRRAPRGAHARRDRRERPVPRRRDVARARGAAGRRALRRAADRRRDEARLRHDRAEDLQAARTSSHPKVELVRSRVVDRRRAGAAADRARRRAGRDDAGPVRDRAGRAARPCPGARAVRVRVALAAAAFAALAILVAAGSADAARPVGGRPRDARARIPAATPSTFVEAIVPLLHASWHGRFCTASRTIVTLPAHRRCRRSSCRGVGWLVLWRRGRRRAALVWAAAWIAGNAIEVLTKATLTRPPLYAHGLHLVGLRHVVSRAGTRSGRCSSRRRSRSLGRARACWAVAWAACAVVLTRGRRTAHADGHRRRAAARRAARRAGAVRTRTSCRSSAEPSGWRRLRELVDLRLERGEPLLEVVDAADAPLQLVEPLPRRVQRADALVAAGRVASRCIASSLRSVSFVSRSSVFVVAMRPPCRFETMRREVSSVPIQQYMPLWRDHASRCRVLGRPCSTTVLPASLIAGAHDPELTATGRGTGDRRLGTAALAAPLRRNRGGGRGLARLARRARPRGRRCAGGAASSGALRASTTSSS